MTGWDLAVVGAGPAGAAAAIGALGVDPKLRVALLDRADFPRDKSCGDGIAPHVIDLLEAAGVTGVVEDQVPIPRLRLDRGTLGVDRPMARPTYVVPRAVFDARLVEAAQTAGAVLVRHKVRDVHVNGHVTLDDLHDAPVVVGADGAYSLLRRTLGLRPGPMAVAIRGYARTDPARAGQQVIAFDADRQPAYAWAFDRGDGLSNIGYGVLAGGPRGAGPTKAELLDRLDVLLPGAADEATDWKGHQLPLSDGRWRPGPGRILLAGDAAGLVNPMTGEGIYYAVATGLAAGRAAARAIAAGDPASAGARYGRAIRPVLDSHLRHIKAAAWLCGHGPVIDAGLRASSRDQRVFDDLVELGLARGRITPRMLRGLAAELVGTSRRRPPGARHHIREHTRNHSEETPACES